MKQQSWKSILQDLEPITGSQKLDDQVYGMLRKAVDFTPDTTDEFKEEQDLLNQILLAHMDFRENPPYSHEGFGDMFGAYLKETNQLNARAGQVFTPMHIVKLMVQISMPNTGEMQYPSDPAAGCGRFMLKTAEYYQEEVGMYNFLYHNTDIDRRMFIYCTMNAILYSIPSINIWGNSISLEFWEAFAVFKPLGLPTQWHHLDKEQVQQFVPVFKPRIPDDGQRNLLDLEKPPNRAERRRLFKQIKNVKQKTLF